MFPYFRRLIAGIGSLTVTSMLLIACGEATTAPVSTSPVTTPATTTVAPTNPTTSTATTATTPATTTAASTTVASVPNTSATTSSSTSTSPVEKNEQEVSFSSGKDTIYGTLRVPASASGKMPAALLLSGSGPTDRNGNSRLLAGAINSHVNFARVLDEQGIISLRYDKLGTGKTGLASYASHLTDVDFNLYLEEARSAYNYLKSRPEVDPQRILILGHSEGGLIALVLADQLKSSNEPKALILAAPLSKPYLDTIRQQISDQYTQAVKNGQATKAQADATLSQLDQIIKSLSQDGKLPAVTDPVLKSIFSPANEKFLTQVANYDPAKIAAGLPSTLSALLLCGQKDQQVTCSDVQNLMQGFQKGGNTKATMYELANVDHVFKEVAGTPNPATDYTNPALPFSIEASQRIVTFVKTAL